MKKGKVFISCLYTLLTLTALITIFSSFGFRRDCPSPKEVIHIRSALVKIGDGDWKMTRLPCTISNLAPGTLVSMKTSISPHKDDSFFLETDFSTASIYFDDEFAFKMGRQKNYPWTMHSPAKEIHAVEFFGDGSTVQVRVDFHSPKQGGRLLLYQPMIGSTKELLMERAYKYGILTLLSIVQISIGIALMFISIYVGMIDRNGFLFFWLGLFSLLTGFWFFGDNIATITLFPQTAFHHLVSNVCLLCSPIVLLQFACKSIKFKNELPFNIMKIMLGLGALSLILLQWTGIYPFYRSIKLCYVVIVISILVSSLLIIREYLDTQSIDAKRFILPILLIFFSAIFGLLSVLFPLMEIFLLLQQVFIFIFLFVIAIFVGIYVKDSLNIRQEIAVVKYEQKLIELQNQEQRKFALQLVKREDDIRQQCHDLRHHLTVLKELGGDNAQLQKYLSALADRIPRKLEQYTENSVVNAVISHYASRCKFKNISLSTELVVPDIMDPFCNSDLCVIFSNFLENAVEACERMNEGERFIHIKSTFHNHIIVILMENSFNGQILKEDDLFRSSKRDNYGVGLASVKSIAEKNHGGADFHWDDKVFYSSAYVHIPENNS